MTEHLALFDATSEDQAWFKKALPELTISSYAGTIQETDLALAHGATIIAMHTSSKVDASVLQALPQLKLIAARSTGYDHINVAAATERHINVVTVPSYGETTVAEYAVLLMLALARKLYLTTEAVKAGQINPIELRGHDLAAKIIGIVGTGKIGRHVIKTCIALGMKVIAYDPFPNTQAAGELGYEYTDLDHLLKISDIVSLHAPATADNQHLINQAALAQMKPSCLIVNTARGSLIDTQALIEALSAKKLAGAALDVVEGEAMLDTDQELHLLSSHQHSLSTQAAQLAVLKQLPNVIITGHNAYNTAEAIERIFEVTAQNITSFLAGHPQNQVNLSKS